MRKLAVIEFVTLDGVMQSLGSPDEDRDGGFEYGGWSAPYGDEVLGKAAGEGLAATTAYLFGRQTYQKMAAHWPAEPDTNPIAAHLNATPKYVVTRTLTTLGWAGSHVLGGDVAASVNALKQHGDGTIVVLGSGVLVQTLIENDLIDEYQLFMHPLVLGSGKRLFRQTPRPIPLRLTSCTPTTTGVLLLSYQREVPSSEVLCPPVEEVQEHHSRSLETVGCHCMEQPGMPAVLLGWLAGMCTVQVSGRSEGLGAETVLI